MGLLRLGVSIIYNLIIYFLRNVLLIVQFIQYVFLQINKNEVSFITYETHFVVLVPTTNKLLGILLIQCQVQFP